jgi:hypothetical protein
MGAPLVPLLGQTSAGIAVLRSAPLRICGKRRTPQPRAGRWTQDCGQPALAPVSQSNGVSEWEGFGPLVPRPRGGLAKPSTGEVGQGVQASAFAQEVGMPSQ